MPSSSSLNCVHACVRVAETLRALGDGVEDTHAGVGVFAEELLAADGERGALVVSEAQGLDVLLAACVKAMNSIASLGCLQPLGMTSTSPSTRPTGLRGSTSDGITGRGHDAVVDQRLTVGVLGAVGVDDVGEPRALDDHREPAAEERVQRRVVVAETSAELLGRVDAEFFRVRLHPLVRRDGFGGAR